MRRRRHNHNHDDEKKRFYLLPGQGGRLYWKKQKFILTWSLIAALIVASALAAVMLWMNRIK
jgi:hypothetical protein